jgi:hypothetical protein
VRLSGGYVIIISVQPDDARLLQDAAAMTQRLWSQEGQDVAEYAAYWRSSSLLVVVTVRLIGTSSTSIFSAVGSSITQ